MESSIPHVADARSINRTYIGPSYLIPIHATKTYVIFAVIGIFHVNYFRDICSNSIGLRLKQPFSHTRTHTDFGEYYSALKSNALFNTQCDWLIFFSTQFNFSQKAHNRTDPSKYYAIQMDALTTITLIRWISKNTTKNRI